MIGFKNSAMNEWKRFALDRAGEAVGQDPTAVHVWLERVNLASSLEGLSNYDQLHKFLGVELPFADAPTAPLDHLPAITYGRVEPAGVCRFRIAGEILFRRPAAEVAQSAVGARAIHLDIESIGGDGDWSDAFGSLLRATGAHITATVERYAYSAAATLFQFADVRRMAAGARLMLHLPRLATIGTPTELRRQAKQLGKHNAETVRFLASRTMQSHATVAGWLSKDTYFTAEESVQLGLADEVVPAKEFAAL
jgi:ATP-dependent protease ClpP protease subunit